MAAPDTSSYVLLVPDAINLPQSRTMLASGGIILEDTGAAGTVTINTAGNLANLNDFATAGYVNYNDATNTFQPITFVAGNGISITNPAGQVGASAWSVLDNTTIQRINVQANSIPLSTRNTLNFVPGAGISVTVEDNPGNGSADVIVTASGGGGGGAPANATYIVQTPDAGLPNAQALDAFAEGILKVDGSGVVELAIADTDYQSVSDNLTSISAVSPDEGTLLVGNGIGFEARSIGPLNSFLSSTGTTAVWTLGNFPQTIILSAGDVNVDLENNIRYVPMRGVVGPTHFHLPDFPVAGEIYMISGFGAGGWDVSQKANQTIKFLSEQTTTGITGKLLSLGGAIGKSVFSSIGILCAIGGATPMFTVIECTGNIDIV